MGVIYETAVYVCISVGPHEGDSEFLAEQICAHVKYIEQWRKQYGEQEDPPQEPLMCDVCGKMSRYETFRCSDCPGTKSRCRNCEDMSQGHEGADHPFRFKAGNELMHFWGCNCCDGRFITRWFESSREIDGKRLRLCKTCMREGEEESSDCSDFVLADRWGDVNVYTDPDLRRFSEGFLRLMQLSHEDHQRVIDACRRFSFRPYFARLWVRITSCKLF